MFPYAGLIQASDGNLYGTTNEGGDPGAGTVYRLTIGATAEQISYETLHVFAQDGVDGDFPSSELVQASDGSFYGTTGAGGVHNRGTVYRITPGAAPGMVETVLYSFRISPDGDEPLAAVLIGPDGDLYGTTLAGGQYNLGTVYRISLDN
jgi:uncharacterized repeat protein (TIGR03803 family)